MNLSISELEQIVGGRLRLGEMPPRDGQWTAIGKVVTDSRIVSAGDVFWGLRGAKHDGAHFAEEAFARGAGGVVTSGRWVAPWAGRWSLEVVDAARALWRLADWNCQRFSGRLVTIDGAVGKTTTAALIDAVLSERHVGETITNLDGGGAADDAAATLVHLRPHDDYALVELHETLVSDMSSVRRLARPDVAVFVHSGNDRGLRIPPSRCEGAIVERLQSAVGAGVSVVVNCDDVHLRRAAADATNAILVGRDCDAHVSATNVESSGGTLRFTVDRRRFCVPAWGRHQLASALAAIAAGRIFGLSDTEIAAGLAGYQPIAGRCLVSQAGETTIVDDSSHRGATATPAALELLGELGDARRRVILCGDVVAAEPADAQSLRAFGEQTVTSAGVDLLVLWGRDANKAAEGANQAGLAASRTIVCETAEQAAPAILSRLRPRDAVLVSGRRSAVVRQAIERHQSQGHQSHRRAA